MAARRRPASEAAFDRLTAYRYILQGVEADVAKKCVEILRDGERQLLGEIASIYERYLLAVQRGEAPGAYAPRGLKTRAQLLRRIRRGLGQTEREINKYLRRRLEAIAREERAQWAAAVKMSLPDRAREQVGRLSRLTDKDLSTIVVNQWGGRLEGAAKEFADEIAGLVGSEGALARLALKEITGGMRDGVGMREILRRSKNAIGADNIAGHRLAAVVRQTVMATSNDVAAQMAEANKDIIAQEQYVATLDSGTCPECGPLDGRVYPLGQVPRPPRHPNCRCYVVPVVKSWRQMGLRGLSGSAKAVLDGRPAPRKTWRQWVMENPRRTRAALGPGKARLLRSGEIKIEDLSTGFRPTTLKELRKLVGEVA